MIDLDGLRVFGAPCNSLPKVGITLAQMMRLFCAPSSSSVCLQMPVVLVLMPQLDRELV